MEKREPFRSLEDRYLNEAMTFVKNFKDLGMNIPEEKELFTKEMKQINQIVEQTKENIPENLFVDCIDECDREKRNKDALYLLKSTFNKKIVSRATLYVKHAVAENDSLGKNEKMIVYTPYQEEILPSKI